MAKSERFIERFEDFFKRLPLLSVVLTNCAHGSHNYGQVKKSIYSLEDGVKYVV